MVRKRDSAECLVYIAVQQNMLQCIIFLRSL